MSLENRVQSMNSLESVKPLLSSWNVQDHAKGERNLAHLTASLGAEDLEKLLPHLSRFLPRSPDPDMSLNNIERFFQSHQGRVQLNEFCQNRGALLDIVIQLMGTSQFFSDLLVANPDDVAMARVPLRSSPGKTELLKQLQQEIENVSDSDAIMKVFRRFRQRQTLRIGTNDIIRERPLEEITLDISRLAECSLEIALQTAWKQLVTRYGEPHGPHGERVPITIMGFGKLGGNELNYSSDIDLMFIYESDGATRGARKSIPNSEFFAKIASDVVRLLSTHTEDGQAYRVDLRLRPEGHRGPLARSLESTLAYYDTMGRTWERQALIKVRPVAGDLALGNRFLKLIEPFIYRKYLSVAEINEIRSLKRRIEQKTRQEGRLKTEVKTGYGGIRDVEFTIQFLQLLNGNDLPEVRKTNTLEAMAALEEVGCFTDQEYQILDSTYKFLRKIEHRLQLMFDLQTHKLPDDATELIRLSRTMGYLGVSQQESRDSDNLPPVVTAFLSEYREKTNLNRRILDHLLHEAFSPGEIDPAPETDLVLDPVPDDAAIQEILGKYHFKDVAKAYRNLMHLAEEKIPFLSTRRCRHFLASIAAPLLQAISETADPDMALVNLEKVSASLGGKAALWELFSFSSAALKLYVELCAWSQFLSEILINNPGMIDELLDSLVLNQPRPMAELQEELHRLCWHADDPELILHSFQDKEILRIGVRDILGKDSLQQTTAALTDVAETILGQVVTMQYDSLVHKFGRPKLGQGARRGEVCRFALLGLGKFGGREMAYQSDLDLILVYEGDGKTEPPDGVGRFHKFQLIDNMQFFTELAQGIIKAISFMGVRGRLYHVDFRLRPTGKSGSLTLPLTEFQKYYCVEQQAQLWELQALTRSRPVYGDLRFQKEVLDIIENAVYQNDWTPAKADEILRMRERLQESGRGRDVKRGYGGIIDIEFLVQLFRLKYGECFPTVRVTNTWDALRAIRSRNLISEPEFQTLWTSHEFLRLVESRLRIVHNRSLDELPDKEEDLEKLARRLGFEGNNEKSAAAHFIYTLDETLTVTRESFRTILEREKHN